MCCDSDYTPPLRPLVTTITNVHLGAHHLGRRHHNSSTGRNGRPPPMDANGAVHHRGAARGRAARQREHDARQCLADSKDLAEAKKRMGRGLLGILKRPTDHTHSDDRWLRRIVG